MTGSPGDIARFAARFVDLLGNPERFRTDTARAVTDTFGISVVFRDDVPSDCDIDGSYDHNLGQITCAAAASPGRERFTILHELGHALGRRDPEFADWLFGFPDAGRLEEERVANAFAAAVLLPEAMVREHIPDEGPTAFDVAQLAGVATASREVVCVRAAQRLRGPGLVVLSRGSIVRFAASRSLPFGIRRGSDQSAEGFFDRASRAGHARQDAVRVVFPSGDRADPLIGDAFTADDGYTFSVLMAHNAPWVDLTPASGGDDGHEVDCDACDRVRFTFAKACATCGDRPCPEHGCACRQRRAGGARKCRDCNVDLPAAAPDEDVLCDTCG